MNQIQMIMFWKFMPLIKTSYFSLQIHFYIPFSFMGQWWHAVIT